MADLLIREDFWDLPTVQKAAEQGMLYWLIQGFLLCAENEWPIAQYFPDLTAYVQWEGEHN